MDDLLGDHEFVNGLIQFSAENAKDVVLVRRHQFFSDQRARTLSLAPQGSNK